MSDDLGRIHEALGKLGANVDNLTKAFEGHKYDTTKEHRKVHDIVVAMSESVRNLTRRIEAVEPVAKEFSENKLEQRGIKRFLVAAYTATGGIIVLVLGKAWDWFMARPHIPAIVVAILALLALTTAALAQEHHHPTEIITGATGLFYEGWMRPDNPTLSCCNRMDCAAVDEVKRVGSQWVARRKSDGKWLVIPPEKVEENRDSPDGQSHMCSIGTTVLCFIAGAGG